MQRKSVKLYKKKLSLHKHLQDNCNILFNIDFMFVVMIIILVFVGQHGDFIDVCCNKLFIQLKIVYYFF